MRSTSSDSDIADFSASSSHFTYHLNNVTYITMSLWESSHMSSIKLLLIMHLTDFSIARSPTNIISHHIRKNIHNTTYIPHPPDGKKREHSLFIHIMNNVHPIIIHPYSLTKPLGVIKQNRHVNPTTTPWLTFWYLGVVWFCRAMERWLHSMGCILRVNCSRRGLGFPGQIAMGESNWTVHIDLTNQPYHYQPLGASLGDESAMEWKRRLCLWQPFLGNKQRWGGS